MPYGYLSPKQKAVVKPFVEDRLVHDLGAGDLKLAAVLAHLGASQVIAIDKEPYIHTPPRKVHPVTCRFEDYPGPIDVGFLSWPRNTFDRGLLSIVLKTKLLIYLGTNTSGSACGFPQMWQQLIQREVLAHEPNEPNTLIVYGPQNVQRRYLPEEYAAVYQDKIWGYSKIHQMTLPFVGTRMKHGK